MIVDIDVRNKNPGVAVTSNDGSNAFKGEMMRKLCLRIAVALVSFAGSGITAKAQDQVVDQVVVTIPFQFVVAGKTLPAGTYHVNRVSEDKWAGLIFSSVENRGSAIVHPIKVESTTDGKAHVSFETAGGEHFLSKIETADNVFTIPVSRAAILLAEKSHTDTSSRSSVGTD
jgi:hypothetical protein